jgi:hypothetical protein
MAVSQEEKCMNIISYCLFGDSPIYTCGAIENARLVGELYPEWESVFYLGRSVTKAVSDELEGLGAKTVRINEPEDFSAMMWRFRAVLIPGVTRVIFRDTDSRLSLREKNLVDCWVESKVSLHVIRDHPLHTLPILGGMWGCQGAAALTTIGKLLPLVRDFQPQYGVDQEFLAAHVYSAFRTELYVNDAFFRFEKGSLGIGPRETGEFIGERIDCVGNPEEGLRSSLLAVERNPFRLIQTRLIEHRRWRKFWRNSLSGMK